MGFESLTGIPLHLTASLCQPMNPTHKIITHTCIHVHVHCTGHMTMHFYFQILVLVSLNYLLSLWKGEDFPITCTYIYTKNYALHVHNNTHWNQSINGSLPHLISHHESSLLRYGVWNNKYVTAVLWPLHPNGELAACMILYRESTPHMQCIHTFPCTLYTFVINNRWISTVTQNVIWVQIIVVTITSCILGWKEWGMFLCVN